MASKQNKNRPGITRRFAAGLAAACGFGLRAAMRGLPMLLIVSGSAFGCIVLWREALADPAFRIAGDTVSLRGAACQSSEARAEVQRLGRLAAGRSLLDPWLLSDLRAAYEKSPWVHRVCRLARVFPDRVAVEFVLRMPVAQVRTRGWYWQVDGEGMLLGVPGQQSPHAGLPEIVATMPGAISRQPGYGETWRDGAVHDALGVLRAIAHSPLSEDLHVRRVVVHRGSFLDTLECRRVKRPRLDLETSEGVLIRWGTYNSGDLPGELRSSAKIDMLRKLLQNEFAAPGMCLDVRTSVAGYAIASDFGVIE